MLDRRLTLVIITSMLMILVGVGYAFFYFYQYSINQQAYEYSEQVLTDAAVELNAYIEDLSQSGSMLANQEEIAEFMSGTTSTRFALAQSTRAQITAFANYKQTVTGIYLLATDGTRISAKPDHVDAYSAELFLAYLELLRTNDLTTPTYDVRISSTCRKAQYFSVIVPVFRSMAAPQMSDYLGSVIIICNTKRLQTIIPASARERLMILENDENLVYCGKSVSMLSNGIERKKTDPSEQLLSVTLPKTGWTLYVAHSTDTVMQRINEMGLFSILIAVLTIVVLLFLLIVLRHSFVNPIVAIARQAERINRSGEIIHNPLPNASEFTMLTDNINGMFERIEVLNKENLAVKTDYYKERILLLQMQINPHFLYNNLECIRGMAVLGRENEIREIVSLTASIYRYSTNAEHMVPLSKELDCVNHYARIMALRYDHQYEVQVKISPELLGTIIPKMLLQPLVENSYTHGFIAANRKTGHIVITAWKTEACLCICVEDDGNGIPEKNLEMVNTAMLKIDEVSDHIGVANVRSRLRLIFGDKGSLVYSARNEGGAIATVKLGHIET